MIVILKTIELFVLLEEVVIGQIFSTEGNLSTLANQLQGQILYVLMDVHVVIILEINQAMKVIVSIPTQNRNIKTCKELYNT